MISWDRVWELRSEVGDEGFDEIVALFLEEADETAAHLIIQADCKAIEADLHSLKGAALNLGFCDLAFLCQEGERFAMAGAADFDFASLKSLYEDTKAELTKGLARCLGA